MAVSKSRRKSGGKLKKNVNNRAFPDFEIKIHLQDEFKRQDFSGFPTLIILSKDMDKRDETMILNLFESKSVAKAMEDKSIFARKNQEITYFATPNTGIPAFMLLGLGEKSKITPKLFANAFHSAFCRCLTLGWEKINLIISPEIYSISNPAGVASWIASIAELSRFNNRFLSTEAEDDKKQLKEIKILFLSLRQSKSQIGESINEGKILGKYTNFAREAVSLPGNRLTPKDLAQKAILAGKEAGFQVKILNKAQLTKLGMNGILSVGKGSVEEPQLIIMDYKGLPKSKKIDLGIVGKGITFDSGGISIKPSADMHEMKGDMGGAAATMYGLAAIAKSKLPLNVMALIGAAENVPDGKAQKPGDVYQSYQGLMVEVLNTDAEGRLVLADLLAFLSEKKPAHIVDIATLTGACLIALGNHLAGLFSNDKNFQDLVWRAGERSLDRVWPMPLYDEYKEDLKSEIADIANIGPRPGGAINAAAFLKHFVPDDIPWAHLDIAGTCILKKDSGFHRKGSTGFGVRILYEIARSLTN